MANFSQFMQQVWICHWTYLIYLTYKNQEWDTEHLSEHMTPMIKDLLMQLVLDEQKEKIVGKEKRIIVLAKGICDFLKEVLNNKIKEKNFINTYVNMGLFFYSSYLDYHENLLYQDLPVDNKVSIQQMFMHTSNLTFSLSWISDFPAVTIGNYPIKKGVPVVFRWGRDCTYYLFYSTFKFLFKTWRIIIPLAILAVAEYITNLSFVLAAGLFIMFFPLLKVDFNTFLGEMRYGFRNFFPFIFRTYFFPHQTISKTHENFKICLDLDFLNGWEAVTLLNLKWCETEALRNNDYKQPRLQCSAKILSTNTTVQPLIASQQDSEYTEIAKRSEISECESDEKLQQQPCSSQLKRWRISSKEEVVDKCDKKSCSMLPRQLDPDLHTLFLPYDDGILVIVGVDNAVHIPAKVLQNLDEHGEQSLCNALANQRSIHNDSTHRQGLKYFAYSEGKSTIKFKGSMYGKMRILLWFCHPAKIADKDPRHPVVQKVREIDSREVRVFHTAVAVVSHEKMFNQWPQLVGIDGDGDQDRPRKKSRK